MKKIAYCLNRICLFHYLLLSFLVSGPLMALSPPQNMVSGLVTDPNGTPLAGVNVLVQSKNVGVMSDTDGTFNIQASPSDVLVFSMVGFKSLTVTLAGREEVIVQLEEDVTVLKEVVLNAGYYTVSEREHTGNIEKVTAVDIEKQPISNPLVALQGRMAGVEVQQTSGLPGAKFNIKIRGRNSIRSDANEPLYIVDGVPYSSTSLGEGQASLALSSGAISPLNNINPMDIESIEVLKDADATAIYGSRGANGVVLITTKRGKTGETRVEINLLTGMGKVSRTLDLMGTSDYLAMRREAFANDGVENYPANAHDINGNWDQGRETDWQKLFFGRTSYLTNAQVSVSGGDVRTRFLVSGNYHGQTSVFPGDHKNDKVTFSANIGHKGMDDRLSLQLSTSFTTNRNNLPGDGLLVQQAYFVPPNGPEPYTEDGSLNWENSTWTNPLVGFERKYESNASTLIGNLTLGYELTKDLTLKTNLGYTENHLREINTNPHTRYDPVYGAGPENSSVLHNQGKRTSWILEPQLDYKVVFGDVTLGALVGATFQEQKGDRLSQYGFGFTSNKLIENLSAASRLSLLADEEQQYRYQALYGRVNLGLMDRYFLNLTGRRDGSSRFGPNKRFGNFGAIGAAWLFSEEGIVQKVPYLSFGKIRASYGTSGSDQIGDYQYLDTYSMGSDQYQGVLGIYPTRLFNPDYNWEENRKWELSMDLGWFHDRVFISGSYYNNRSSNQLVGIPLPATTGFSSINGNLEATVENRGWELELSTVNARSERFQWTSSFNLTLPKNLLVSFPNLEESTYANQLVVGESLNSVKLYQWNGVDTETGLHTFEDFNGDGTISSLNDRSIIKNLDPKFYGGLSNHVSLGRFELDCLFQFTKQSGLNFLSRAAPPGVMANQPKVVLQRWQQVGDVTDFQRFSSGTPDTYRAFQLYQQSTAVATDASFIRLQNISVSYQLASRPTEGFSCDLFLRGQNLFTWTNYLGTDPEARNPLAVPSLRMLSIGTRLNF